MIAMYCVQAGFGICIGLFAGIWIGVAVGVMLARGEIG